MTVPLPTALLDAVVVGAGPAGCSAASWMAQLGLSVALIDREDRPAALLRTLPVQQSWVLGEPERRLGELADDYERQVLQTPQVSWLAGRQLQAASCRAEGGWTLETGRETLQTRCLVLATGLRPRRPADYFQPGDPPGRVLDAVGLTERRAGLASGSRVLLLGGGDNAVENALYLAEHGHRVTVCTRSGWRAQASLVARMKDDPRIVLREGEPVPRRVRVGAQGVEVASALAGAERFDVVAVLFGYEPEPAAYERVREALRAQDLPCPALDGASWRLPDAPPVGLFVAGDASGRWHPCVQTALADGVHVAKQVQHQVRKPLSIEQARAVMEAASGAHRGQVLRLTGLRCDARLGWLNREKHGPQPIQVDAELNMGAQPLLPDDDDLAHVLDYRKVRQIIIDECNAEHTHLIETLLGKLCLRLARLPGVQGVRVQVTKLEIFDDCHVAMSAEHGRW